MPRSASAVRRIGSGWSSPSASSPSPSRVTSARSTTVLPTRHRSALADVELDRVRADVDHGEPPGSSADERLQPARDADVRPRSRPELAHGGGRRAQDPRTRRRSSADARSPLESLTARPCSRRRSSARAACARRPRAAPGSARPPRRGAARACTLGSRPARATPSAASTAATSAAASGNAALSTGPHCSSPSSSTRLELLHVQQAVAHLDRRVARVREQVELVALLLAVAAERAEAALGGAEARRRRCATPSGVRSAELAGSAPAVQLPREVLERLLVFVCCSPERSTPWSARNARVSAATWNASVVAQRVDSSSMREPSG